MTCLPPLKSMCLSVLISESASSWSKAAPCFAVVAVFFTTRCSRHWLVLQILPAMSNHRPRVSSGIRYPQKVSRMSDSQFSVLLTSCWIGHWSIVLLSQQPFILKLLRPGDCGIVSEISFISWFKVSVELVLRNSSQTSVVGASLSFLLLCAANCFFDHYFLTISICFSFR